MNFHHHRLAGGKAVSPLRFATAVQDRGLAEPRAEVNESVMDCAGRAVAATALSDHPRLSAAIRHFAGKAVSPLRFATAVQDRGLAEPRAEVNESVMDCAGRAVAATALSDHPRLSAAIRHFEGKAVSPLRFATAVQDRGLAEPRAEVNESVMDCAGRAVAATALSDHPRLSAAIRHFEGKAVSPLRFATAVQDRGLAEPRAEVNESVMDCAGRAVAATALSDHPRLSAAIRHFEGKAVSPLRFATAVQDRGLAEPRAEVNESVMDCAGRAVAATALSDHPRLSAAIRHFEGKAVSPLRFATAVQDRGLAEPRAEVNESVMDCVGRAVAATALSDHPRLSAAIRHFEGKAVSPLRFATAVQDRGLAEPRAEVNESVMDCAGRAVAATALSDHPRLSAAIRHFEGKAVSPLRFATALQDHLISARPLVPVKSSWTAPAAHDPLPRGARGKAGRRAFTLVELLVVISIIGVLAALIIPVAGSVARVKKINTAQAELQQLETALENYKAKYGVYPPSNGTNGVVNQLYYELSGVIKTNGTFLTLDGNTSLSTGAFGNQFYGAGVLNCSQGGGEEGVTAKNFLPGLKANEIAYATNGTGSYATIPYYYLVTSVGGPDVGYHPPLIYNPPLTGNPFRYVSPGLHNPNSYDLWVQLSINSTPGNPHLYLVCNWSQQVQRNSPMP